MFLLSVVAEKNNGKLVKFSWAHYNLLGPETFRAGSGVRSRTVKKGEVGGDLMCVYKTIS